MAWQKYSLTHTITATGTTFTTTDNSGTGISGTTEISAPLGQKNFVFELSGGSGTTGAVVKLQVRNANGAWIDAATITLSSTGDTVDSVEVLRAWDKYRFNCTSLTGTTLPTVTVNVVIG